MLSTTITVNSLLDQTDAAGSTTVTLRNAITQANLDGGATIQFAPGLVSQSDGAGPGVIALSIAGDDTLGPSALAVQPGVNITISGPTGNAGITIERAPSAGAMRLFAVDGSLTLMSLTLRGGDAVGSAGGNAGWGAPAVAARAWAGPSSSTRGDCSP